MTITFALSCFLVLSENGQSHHEARSAIDKSHEFRRLIAIVDSQRYWITNHSNPDRNLDLDGNGIAETRSNGVNGSVENWVTQLQFDTESHQNEASYQ